jgi:hypothetical protein
MGCNRRHPRKADRQTGEGAGRGFFETSSLNASEYSLTAKPRLSHESGYQKQPSLGLRATAGRGFDNAYHGSIKRRYLLMRFLTGSHCAHSPSTAILHQPLLLMNPITAAEKIKRIKLGESLKNIDKLPLLTLPENWFGEQWSDGHKRSDIIDKDSGKIILPFDEFRFSLPKCRKTQMDPEPYTECYGVVLANDFWVSVNFIYSHARDVTKTPNSLTPCENIHVRMALDRSGGTEVHIQMCYDKSKWVTVNDGQHIRKSEHFLIMPLVMLASFYASGAYQPILATPSNDKRNGKSVEWINARTYYTVVHRRHAANSKSVKHGAIIGDNSALRTAHARRAHFRVLRSEKWGASIGRRIMVRACWVGPKEWQDAESKQIYRIFEPK